MLYASKTSSYSKQVVGCKGDTKKLYKLVYSLMGTSQENPLPDNDNPEDLANEFADYFMEKIGKIRDSLADKPTYKLSERTPKGIIPKSMSEFRLFTQDEVRSIILSMPTKSSEIDVLPTEILKKCIDEILPCLTRFINTSLKDGVFVSTWKTSIIKPLLKKHGLELVTSSYRPVSNLPFLSKLPEKCAMDRFNEHCGTNNLLLDYQSTYRKWHSCETSLLKLVNDILWAMESQCICPIMAIDNSAVFDTVDHSILLAVLEQNFGLTGTVLSWYDSYLSPRSCKVKIKESYSTERSLQFSVPQGSCAGAQVYNAYCSTMHEVVKRPVLLYGFADDHTLRDQFKANDRDEEIASISRLEKSAEDLKTWMDENRLRMNSEKTEFIMFGSKVQLSKCDTTSLTVNGSVIPKSDIIRQLGAWLDSNLNFKHHIVVNCRSAMMNLQCIKLIRRFLTQEATETLLLATVMSHLDYSNSILADLPDVDIKKFQRIQNICAKLTLRRTKYDSNTDCLDELHWLPVRKWIQLKILTLTYKCLDCQAPVYLRDLLVRLPVRCEGLRSEKAVGQLLQPRTKFKTFAARSFSCMAPRLWNQLSEDIKTSDNIDIFKAKLKTFLYKNNLN